MRFGVFEVDPAAGRLWKNGRKVALQDQPFQILCLLLERPGEVVTREEIQQRLWPSGVHVDFERGLNKAVLKLRDALGDSAENPRFVETLPRRGYRLIVPVDTTVSSPAEPGPAPPHSRAWGLSTRVGLGVVIAMIVVTALLVLATRRVPPRSAPSLVQFSVPLPPGLGLSVYDSASLAFSNDGRRLAFAARGGEGEGIYVRSLDGLDAVRLAGSEGARSLFFSPDDDWIGFEARERLHRVAATGGAPQPLCDMPFPSGAATGSQGGVVLVPSFTGGLFAVPAGGGRLERLTVPDRAKGEGAHVWPRSLPDGRGVLFTIWSGGSSYDHSKVAVLPADGGPWRILVEGAYEPRYVPSGHLVFVRGNTLLAVPFDLDRLAVTGPPVSVLPSLASDASTGAALYDVSRTGALAYVPGRAIRQQRHLVWVDRSGRIRRVRDEAMPYLSPRLSPDGRRVAAWVEEAEAEVWLYDVARDALSRATFTGDNHTPTWSPDGASLAFESGRDFVHHLFVRPLDGAPGERQLTFGAHHHYLSDWSADGRFLSYTEFNPETGADVLVVDQKDGATRAVARSPFSEKEAVFSPDGRWIAYGSNESGLAEVYVQSFPDGGPRLQISSGGGTEPAWARNGESLFFRHGPGMLEAPFRAGAAGKPHLLFEGRFHDNIAPSRSYDITSDGRFLMVEEPPVEDLPREIRVIFGWSEDLKRRVPGR